MIRPMVRFALWGVASRKNELVRTLHEMEVFHLVASPRVTSLPDGDLHKTRVLGATLLGMLEVLSWDEWNTLDDVQLERARAGLDKLTPDLANEVERSIESFRTRLSNLLQEKEALEESHRALRKSHQITSHFSGFLKEERASGNEVSLWWIVPSLQGSLLGRIRKVLKKHTSVKERVSLRYHSVRVEKDVLLAVSVPPSALEEVETLFRENGAAAWRAPHVFEKETPYASFSAVEEGLQWLPARLDEIERELSKTRKEWGPKLAALFIALDEQAEVVEVERGLTEKGELFFVEGWVPGDALSSVVSCLRERFDRDVLLSWRYPSDDEWHKVPTALSNPGPFAPFELFLKLLSPPKYSGLDPTVLIGIFFPFFSGCMVGDIGYGFFIALFGFLARRFGKSVLVSHIGSILYFIAGWSIAWGIAYGEFFGDMGHRLLHMRPLWVERSEAVMPVLVFTVVLGLAHVCLGHLLGLIEGIRHRHKHLWMEKLGNLVILSGLVLGIVIFKGWLPDKLFSVSLSAVIVGTVVLLMGGGLGGVIEYLGTIGNVLSYVRIGAIGLSSAILAMVASSFVDVLGISILGIMMALAMHLLNFVLALAGSGLHAARLHYVEFLGKFYVGGGIAYRPFGKRRSPSWKKP